MFYARFGKRLLDLFITVPALIALSPIMAVVSLVSWRQMGRPILFRQQRPGLHGKPFWLAKFRTMTSGMDAEGHALPDGQRLTPVGHFLRRTSLDELPELVNVLAGDMSLVGPRPLLMRYLPRYTPEQMRRHEAPPGLTGWAQVNGRNNLSWEQKFVLDVWYVDHRSFWLDLKILFLTLRTVFRRDGISEPGHATMEEFRGSEAA